MITESQFIKLQQLSERGSMDSLKNVLNMFELDSFQTFSLACAHILKKAVISLDTGLGKTLIAGALINLDINNGKWLFVVKNNNLIQTAQKLVNIVTTDRVVQFCNGTSKNINILIDNCTPNAVVVITYDAFNNLNFLNYLFKIRKTFTGIIIDESHNIGNKGSNRSEVLKHLLRNSFDYQYMLTATPLSVDPFQVCNQINIIDPEMIPDPEALVMHHTDYVDGKKVGYHDLDGLYNVISMRYISFTRSELGIKGDYKPKLWLCKTNKGIEIPKSIEELKSFKSYEDNTCLDTVVNLVKDYNKQGKIGLVYANLTTYKDILLKRLSEICSVNILDGRVNAINKRKIQYEFNSGKYSVLISNLQEGQDLPCDYIIFYELNVKYKQFIGRGERGLSGKDLDIHFVIVDKSYEVDFFYNNIYKRSLLLEIICKKDISEIKEIERQLKTSLSEEALIDLEMLSTCFDDEDDCN